MRGSSVPELDLPAAGLIEFRAAPGTATQRYRVSLVRQHGGSGTEPVATLADLRARADGYVYCYADAARLTAGSYVLRVQADTDNNTASTAAEFPFSLRPHATDPAR
jgi:hypothetical protein